MSYVEIAPISEIYAQSAYKHYQPATISTAIINMRTPEKQWRRFNELNNNSTRPLKELGTFL